MLKTLWATVQQGKIELLEGELLPEGTKVLVTLLPNSDESNFWQLASQDCMDTVWNNPEDDVYAELLQS